MDTSVLIVGAGPTGLVLACELARRGVDHRLIERADTHFTGSRGKGLQPRTLEVFDDLGLVDRVLATGAPYPAIRRYAGGQVVWEGHMHEETEPTADVPYPNIVMIPQARTEELLRERLAELGGRVELGVELLDLTQDEDGVTATTSAGPIRARYLVGADGGRSSVRKLLGVGFGGETREEERMLLGDVRANDLDRDHWHTWVDAENPKRWLALCPLPGTDAFQAVTTIGPDTEPTFETLREVAARLAGVGVRDASWLSLYRPNIRIVDRFRVGRAFLAGDAAHVHSPAGGQGLNTGVQDAYNLGWKLAAVLGGAPAELLDTYEEERLPVAADVLGISTRLHNGSDRRGAETEQLGISYRGGSLAGDGERAGDRAPDGLVVAEDGRALRLFDVFRGPHATLLRFGGAPDLAVGEQVRSFAVTGEAGAAYGVSGAGYALVRPDGHIGTVGPDPERIMAYLSRFQARVSA